MKNAKIQTPETVTYEVRWKSRRTNEVVTVPGFKTEAEALEYRAKLNRSQFPPVWSEVYRLRTKKT